jgi:hypothetical protein
MNKKRKLPEDPNGGNQISVCGLHLDQLLCNNTKYTVFDLCELCLDEGVRCRIGKHPNLSSSGMSMVPGFPGAPEDTAIKHYTTKGKKKNLPSGYRFFFVDQRELLLQSHPQLTFSEMSPIISKNWAKVDEVEKEKYKKLAEAKRTQIIQEAIASQGKKARMVSAFQFYTKDQRAIIKEINPNVSFAEISTTISKSWASEDESVKAVSWFMHTALVVFFCSCDLLCPFGLCRNTRRWQMTPTWRSRTPGGVRHHKFCNVNSCCHNSILFCFVCSFN